MNEIESLLQSIKERADRATEGPWQKCSAHDGKCRCLSVWSISADAPVAEVNRKWGDGAEGTEFWMEYGSFKEEAVQANKDFIAASRTDVPRLVEAVRVLAEALNEMSAFGFNDHALQRATEILKGV